MSRPITLGPSPVQSIRACEPELKFEPLRRAHSGRWGHDTGVVDQDVDRLPDFSPVPSEGGDRIEGGQIEIPELEMSFRPAS